MLNHNKNIQLESIHPGESVRVTDLSGCAVSYRQRLLALGLCPGSVFTLLRRAPLGDPVVLRLSGGALVSLRQAEAAGLCLEKVGE